MQYYLAKTDPRLFDRRSGARENHFLGRVTNAQAVRAIREMRPGIESSSITAADLGRRGDGRVRSPARDDPKNPKSAVVEPGILRTAGAAPPRSAKSRNQEIRRLGAGGDKAALDHGGGRRTLWKVMRERYPKARI